MNSSKRIRWTWSLAAGLAILGSSAAAQPPAQAGSQMAFINAMKAAYASTAQASGSGAAAQSINLQAQGDPACAKIDQARKTAAQVFVRNKLPPDPTSVIQNSTCFLDVMDIRIPTSGFGALDFLINQMGGYLQTSACSNARNFWNQMVTNVTSGNVSGLIAQGFNPLPGSTQTVYSGGNRMVPGPGGSTTGPNGYEQASNRAITTSVGFLTEPLNRQISDLAAQIQTLQQQLNLQQNDWLYGGNTGGG